MEETIIFNLFNSISFAFIAIVLLATYGINEIITKITKKKLSRYFKSLVSLIVGIATMVLYLYKLDASLETVLLSFLICTFGYDLIIKPILKAIKRHFADSKSVWSRTKEVLLLNCVVLPFVISRKIIARLNHRLNVLLMI